MSSDLYVFDGSFCNHLSPEMVSSDTDFFFSESFPPFCDSDSIDILQELSNNQFTQNQVHNSDYAENCRSKMVSSSSPPSHQLENLNLHQTNQLQTQENSLISTSCARFSDGFTCFSELEALKVKSEECKVNCSYNHQCFMPHSYSGVENVAKLMQRSYSSNSFEGKPEFLFRPRFDALMESSDHQNRAFNSPENDFLGSQMRRACSTGDLQNIRTAYTRQRSFSSPLASENSMEEGSFKVGRYSAEERRERISKYRAKRNQRNFTKTIKYACRKTLADNRPRIRGRFARTDETDIPKAACSNREEEEDELWFDGFNEEEEVRSPVGCVNSSQQQFHYYGYGY